MRRAPDHDGDSDRKRRERRQQFVEAAVRVIRRDGPDASMDRFAAEAGVAKPILYRVFGDRAGLHRAVGEYAFASLGAGIDQVLAAQDLAPRQMVAGAIDSYLGFVEREPALYSFLAERADPGAKRQAVDDYLARVSRQVAVVLGDRLRGAGEDSGAAEPWAFGIVGMAVAAGSWWLERGTMSRAQLGAYLTRLVCDGLPGVGAGGPGAGEPGAGDPGAGDPGAGEPG